MHATVEKSHTPGPTPARIEAHAALNDTESLNPSLEVADFNDGDFDKAISGQQTQGRIGQDFYRDILRMVETYKLRERRQRRYGLLHFVGAAITSIGCFVAVWWSPRNFVAFILIMLSTFGIMGGTLNGLIGGLFVGSELRALAEFEWQVAQCTVPCRRS